MSLPLTYYGSLMAYVPLMAGLTGQVCAMAFYCVLTRVNSVYTIICKILNVSMENICISVKKNPSHEVTRLPSFTGEYYTLISGLIFSI